MVWNRPGRLATPAGFSIFAGCRQYTFITVQEQDADCWRFPGRKNLPAGTCANRKIGNN
jgi:hypothetical protein